MKLRIAFIASFFVFTLLVGMGSHAYQQSLTIVQLRDNAQDDCFTIKTICVQVADAEANAGKFYAAVLELREDNAELAETLKLTREHLDSLTLKYNRLRKEADHMEAQITRWEFTTIAKGATNATPIPSGGDSGGIANSVSATDAGRPETLP